MYHYQVWNDWKCEVIQLNVFNYHTSDSLIFLSVSLERYNLLNRLILN